MQISKRLVGIHPDKVLGALQQHIDAGHEKSALQAIPDLQLQHPQFHNELEQQKARLSAKLIEGVKVLDRKTAEVFRCVNCGGGLARQNPESTHVICQYCGCDAEHPATNIHLERWNKALDLESNFTIGDFFQYNNQRWQAIGVQLFSGRVREYDSEDGWETNFSRYTTWWMLNETRELAWLVDDGSDRYWSEKFIPEKPAVPDSKDKNYEHGIWKLEFAAGEFSYQPKLGEAHQSAESPRLRKMPITPGGKSVGFYTGVESRLDKNDKVKEIEFIRSREIPDSEMFTALGKDLELTDIKRWRNSIRALIVSLPLLLAVAFYLNRGGEAVTQSVDLNTASTDVQMQSIEVKEAGTMMQLTAAVNAINNNSWLGINFALQNSEGEPQYDKYLEFWRESGRDSDGAWQESKRSIKWHVRIDEPGTYQTVVSFEPASTTTKTQLRLESEPNRTSSTPFLFGGVAGFLFMMLFRSKLSSVTAVAASIAVKLKRRFEPGGKPKRERKTAKEQWS